MDNLIERIMIGFFTGALLSLPVVIRTQAAKKKKGWIYKQAKKKGVSVIEYLKTCKIPDNVFLLCEADRGNDEALKNRMEWYVKNKFVTEAQSEVLFEEYMKEK